MAAGLFIIEIDVLIDFSLTMMTDRIETGSCTSLVNMTHRDDHSQYSYRKRHSSTHIGNIPTATMMNRQNQQRYKLILDGSVQMCRVPHAKNIIEKIRFSRFLRHWEEHHITLASNEIIAQPVCSSLIVFP